MRNRCSALGERFPFAASRPALKYFSASFGNTRRAFSAAFSDDFHFIQSEATDCCATSRKNRGHSSGVPFLRTGADTAAFPFPDGGSAQAPEAHPETRA